MSSATNTIKAIDKTSVHRICSGQVVLTLAVAVKELVENSLDAGATVVEVRLKEYGSELVEVSDNGGGVHPDNFEGLTLKHHTSKLRDFSDIMSVETFGFRGEALSSLCALSDLTVTTRHSSQDCGTHLVFDRNGHISERTQSARQVGTTVNIVNLFSTLPVRHKEFHRNLKREFTKMTQLLYAYCLVSTGVKISCVNQTKKGGRTTFVSTQGCKTVKENIACVFGAKQLSNLMQMEVKPPPEEVMEELKVQSEDIRMFDLEGYVSSCRHGEGRATNDRQFYFINSRPCEPSKITKIINEVYHQFNMHQSPFVFLNVKVARDSVDVNVTPDKRQVFLDHEKLLVAILKASALSLYESIPSTFLMNNIPQRSTGGLGDNRSTETKTTLSKLSLWRHKSDNKRELEPQGKPERENKQLKLDKTFAFKSKQPSPRKMNNEKEISEVEEIEPEVKMNGRVEGSGDLDNEGVNEFKEDDSISVETEGNGNTSAFSKLKEYTSPSQEVNTSDRQNLNENSSQDNATDRQNPNEDSSQGASRICDTPVSDSEISSQEHDTGKPFGRLGSEDCSKTDPLLDAGSSVYDTPVSQGTSSALSQESDMDKSNITFDTGVEDVDGRKRLNLDLNLDKLRLAQDNRLMESNSSKSSGPVIKFRAIIDPTKNNQAEQELSREITKDMFSKMEIIGQFNLGFIISKLNSDLFIIDQHATDEKYNFETLQKTTVISNQKLVVPQKLELTAINECILIENLEVFRKNGFEFKIDEAAPVTQKVSLTAVPMSRNWVFGKEDIDELLFMLQDSPNTLCRPSRVRAMFASRACRKSVMIGTSLSKQVMRQLVTHMGEIEQPWNCPHGRPTMRHLVNLDLTQ